MGSTVKVTRSNNDIVEPWVYTDGKMDTDVSERHGACVKDGYYAAVYKHYDRKWVQCLPCLPKQTFLINVEHNEYTLIVLNDVLVNIEITLTVYFWHHNVSISNDFCKMFDLIAD